MPHKFSPHSIERLLRADRFEGLDISEFLADMGLTSGMTCADIGCGPGFFTQYILGVVGSEGLVYAVDVQEEMLEALGKSSAAEHLRPLLSIDESLPIDDASIDFAFCAYVLHEAAVAESFMGEIKRVMKGSSKLVVIDWDRLREEHGPPYEDRISRIDARSLIERVGLKVLKESTFSTSHYLLQATKGD